MENEKEEKIEIEDGDGGYTSKEQSFKAIALEQYNRTLREGSKEMVTGGVKQVIVQGEVCDIFQPNQPEVFMNHIDMLYGLLKPHVSKNKDIKDKIKSVKVSLKKIGEAYSEESKKLTTNFNSKVNRTNHEEKMFNYHFGNCKSKHDFRKLEIYKNDLLKQLSFLLDHMNYFETVGGSY